MNSTDYPFQAAVETICPKTGHGLIMHGKRKLTAKGVFPPQTIHYQLSKNKRAIQAFITLPDQELKNSLCPHYFTCNGCALLPLPIDLQLGHKQQLVNQLFQDDKIKPIISNPTPNHYRNKAEFTFTQNLEGNKRLGFMDTQRRGHSFTISQCSIIPPWMVEAGQITEKLFQKHSIEAFFLPKMKGDLKNLMLRSNSDQTQFMFACVVQDRTITCHPFFSDWIHTLANHFSDRKLSFYAIEQQVRKGTPTTVEAIHLCHEKQIDETITVTINHHTKSYVFPIEPLTFFQPNPVAAKGLYQKAIEALHLSSDDVLGDLYCGIGTFGMIASPHVKKVVGIEIVQPSVTLGLKALERNHISNMEILHGDVSDLISQQMEFGITKVIIDPPRAGLDQRVIQALSKMQPLKIAYISCNPHTQARDATLIQRAGYTIEAIMPVDQFTHTPHLENIVVFKKS